MVAVALVIGFFMLLYDRRTDDAGIEAFLLSTAAFTLTLAAPKAAIDIALAIGLPIAGWSLWQGDGAGLVALVFSSAGALVGYVMRRGSLRTRVG